MSKKFTRRTALKGIGASAALGSAACAGRLPESQGPLRVADQIDTVVVVMMENRSFDHYFGSYSLVEGRAEVDGLNETLTNPLADGTLVAPSPADQNCIADPSHGWDASHRQFAAGAMSGFALEHEARHGRAEAHRALGYWERDRLSCFYGLADNYALCQRWFASVMGPTFPNRFFSLLGHSDGLQSNDFATDAPIVFQHVFNAGKSYGIYYGNFPFAALSPRMSLGDPEMNTLENFFDHAASGSLPNLSWIDPIYGRQDDHPPAHPVAGQVLVQSIYNALAQSPQWERTLLIVTYDEHGGFYDHVPPPLTVDARADQGFDQLGFRVPSLVVGPYVRDGLVDGTVYDHTSIYATLRQLWDLPSLSEREANANGILGVLDEERLQRGEPRAPVELPAIDASDDELFAPECVIEFGGFFSAGGSPAGRSLTGQPEAEALMNARYGGHAKNRIAQTDEVYRRFLNIARDMGVLT